MTAAPSRTTPRGVVPPWRVADLSVVDEGGHFLVGDPLTGVFVSLPPIGVEVIGWLAAGSSTAQVAALARESAGEDVDIEEFLGGLEELGFVARQDPDHPEEARGTDATGLSPDPHHRGSIVSRVGASAAAAAGVLSLALVARRPDLAPTASDLLALGDPATSLAALTGLTYVLALLHEGAHWHAARLAGVRARVSITRRLYFLTLETDLTGLWALPRRRRYWPLLAGMAFDVVVLCAAWASQVLLGPDTQVMPLLRLVAFVAVTGLATQCWIFLRTDLYAVLVVATGCVDLYRTTWLSILHGLRLAGPEHRRAYASAPRRDRRVAAWYRWVWAGGMALAAVFLVGYYLPAVAVTISWTVQMTVPVRLDSLRFWEATALALLIVSPSALTGWVLLRDLARTVSRRVARPG